MDEPFRPGRTGGADRPARQRERALRRHADRWGAAAEHDAWRLVRERYEADDLAAAYALAQSLGAGHEAMGLPMFRLIEAEHLTRTDAERWRAAPWLEIEAIPGELPYAREKLEARLTAAADEAAHALGWTPGPPVLTTIFAEAADAPWTPDRHGFCTPKADFAKICLPRYLLDRPRELAEAMRHEMAHVIVGHLSAQRAPRWFDEAVAMTVGGGLDEPTMEDFADEPDLWFDPDGLDDAFLEDREDEEGEQTVWDAYQQSAWLGAFLAGRIGAAGLARVAAACAPGGFAAELRLRLTGGSPIDAALRRVARTDARGLFADAYDELQDRYGEPPPPGAPDDGGW